MSTRGIACLSVTLLAWVGCGSTTTHERTVVVEKTVTAGGQAATAARVRSDVEAFRSLDPASRASTLTSFRSPTGNIGCHLGANFARCDIQRRTWSSPPKPAECDLDWGQGVEVSAASPAVIVCAGDTALDPSAPVLSYGQAAQVGSTECLSREDGVVCVRNGTGHGFFVARERYVLF